MKVWSRDYDAHYLLRVNCFRRFEYSTIGTVPSLHTAQSTADENPQSPETIHCKFEP